MEFRPAWQLRAEFARRLSILYAREVPAYSTLVDTCEEINDEVMKTDPDRAQRLGDIARVTAERHGAIRVGTPDELRQAGAIFAAVGMYPVGFYDLRDADPTPLPVVSTAFRPTDAVELARNPFRVFVSMLTADDARFFDTELSAEVGRFLGRRRLFGDELLTLAADSAAHGGLPTPSAERFLDLACASFALGDDPVDRVWYQRLERVSSVAADIAGLSSTHINHLTPRVLDIDELHQRMTSRGLEMIEDIQGPPRWNGPDMLLRQTSFRALAEQRLMREPDGTTRVVQLRVRFGEVEARGIAPTPAGRALIDRINKAVSTTISQTPGADKAARDAIAAQIWRNAFPATERESLQLGLAYFTFEATRTDDAPPFLDQQLDGGWLTATPIVYEDFLPRSAAGIFNSNLTGVGATDASRPAAQYDIAWLAATLERPVPTPEQLAGEQQLRSLEQARARLVTPVHHPAAERSSSDAR